jgi:glycosyltransferase involved in cell wall biosynthesis
VAVNQGFGPLKNVTTLLEAFTLVRARFTAARLRLIGPGYEIGGPAHDWARSRELTEGVDFVGSIDHADVCAVLDASDLLVHPSRLEACPMTVIEAMARSVPVVGGCDSGGVGWVAGDGRSGALVDVRAPRAIADAVLELLHDDRRWDACANVALASARRRFTLSTVVEHYESVLAEGAGTICAGRGRGAVR